MDKTDSSISIQSLPAHQAMWASCESLLSQRYSPQALLLQGPRHAEMLSFAYRWIATFFCEHKTRPCGQCRACEAIQSGFHPDLTFVTKEDGASIIKIEQIRMLQETIYQTPSWQQSRFVLIYPTDALNLAASNAMLKLLEEPPLHLKFILVSESYDVLPTLLSRCQRLYFNYPESFKALHYNYLNLTSHYPESSLRHQSQEEKAKFYTILNRLLSEDITVSEAALHWKTTELDHFLWFYYLFIATCIARTQCHLTKESNDDHLIQSLCRRLNDPGHLYAVLDHVVLLMATLRQKITLNQVVVVESLLLRLVEVSHASY